MSHRGKFNRRDLKEKRQKNAIVRLEERNKRSAQQQLAKLDAALGVGVGAVKERLKLNELLKGS